MADLTPKSLSFRISLGIGLGIGILATLYWLLFLPFDISYTLLIFVGSTSISYFFLSWGIKRFIEKRFRIIYKTIHNLKIGLKKEAKKINMNKDVFGEINREVIEWDRSNREEIERLNEQEEFRREFLGNVSHELKTPIFSIQGYILTLLEGGLEDKNVNRKFLMKAEKSVNRMIEMLEDLDQISKMEYNKLPMNFSKFNLLNLTEEIMDSLDYEAKKKEVCLEVQEKQKPIMVKADKVRISQVLTNLIFNAILYSNKKKAKVKIKFYDLGENVLVEIADNGQGIPQKHLPRLFERFYRIDKGRSRDEGGSGLGLAIVKHIIEAHEQSIDVRSKEGEGSVFSFTLKKA